MGVVPPLAQSNHMVLHQDQRSGVLNPRKSSATHDDDEEITSPLKEAAPTGSDKPPSALNASQQMFQAKESGAKTTARKRKSKGSGSNSSQTPDLNLPMVDTTALVPAGLVIDRVNQLAHNAGGGGGMTSEELSKKQRRCNNQNDAKSAAAANSSPRRAQ